MLERRWWLQFLLTEKFCNACLIHPETKRMKRTCIVWIVSSVFALTEPPPNIALCISSHTSSAVIRQQCNNRLGFRWHQTVFNSFQIPAISFWVTPTRIVGLPQSFVGMLPAPSSAAVPKTNFQMKFKDLLVEIKKRESHKSVRKGHVQFRNHT